MLLRLQRDHLMHLVGQLSNPSASLEPVLAAPTAERRTAVIRALPVPTDRLGNGVVQRAVVKVLARAEQPWGVAPVQTAVEELLGRPVPRNSIYWCLAAGSRGERRLFERVTRGRYRLRRD